MFGKHKKKIFCISAQRTGTTSVGVFFKRLGYKVADWKTSHQNDWSYLWDIGDFEKIFSSRDFKQNQVFEDSPWWLPEFYKFLFHRFPDAKFILFTRDSSKWFDSMLNHSGGKTLGNTKRHCKVYRRENDFFKIFPERNERLNYNEKKIDNLMDLRGYESHYKELYQLRNEEIEDFFLKHSHQSFFKCELEDLNKWEKLANFLELKIPENFEVHANKTTL